MRRAVLPAVVAGRAACGADLAPVVPIWHLSVSGFQNSCLNLRNIVLLPSFTAIFVPRNYRR